MEVKQLLFVLASILLAFLALGGVLTMAAAQSTSKVTTSAIVLVKTVGLEPHACGVTNEISVPQSTQVYYCFRVFNTGDVPLERHDLEDSHLGVILNGLPFTLAPAANVFVTQTEVIEEDTTNTATWTAYNLGPTDLVTSTASATVHMLLPEIELVKTVGLDPHACADADEIRVEQGAEVVYCYTIINTGGVTLERHNLEDSHLGLLLDGLVFSLAPGATVFLTQTEVIEVNTTNTATWTAYNPGPTHEVSATAAATVLAGYSLYLPVITR
jgi:hypothetical protein